VNWFDAARFVNWLHNGRPEGQPTSLTTENGAYNLLSNSEIPVPRQSAAKFFLPNENEWYKAAYFKGFMTSGYWLYPAKSDVVPGKSIGGLPNNANYNMSPLGLADVQSFFGSPSPSQTFDQGGNVDEWLEEIESTSPVQVVLRGGSFQSVNPQDLSSLGRLIESPSLEYEDIGFRVAAPSKDDYPEFEFLGVWEFTDKGSIAFGHNGSERKYTQNNMPIGALWSVQDGGFGVRIDFEKSGGNCGGSNNLPQSGTATLKIKTIKSQKIFAKWEGVGELQDPGYDWMKLKINNVLIGSAEAAGGNKQCLDGPVKILNFQPGGYDLGSGNHTIFVEADTKDGQFHVESFYKFRFSNKP
jgi:hypothetical protein